MTGDELTAQLCAEIDLYEYPRVDGTAAGPSSMGDPAPARSWLMFSFPQ